MKEVKIETDQEQQSRMFAKFMGFESQPFSNEDGSGYSVRLIGYPNKGSMGFDGSWYGTKEDCISKVLNWAHHMRYHTSWEWLMPVWEKIIREFDKDTRFKSIHNEFHVAVDYGDITRAFDACAQFIKQLNP